MSKEMADNNENITAEIKKYWELYILEPENCLQDVKITEFENDFFTFYSIFNLNGALSITIFCDSEEPDEMFDIRVGIERNEEIHVLATANEETPGKYVVHNFIHRKEFESMLQPQSDESFKFFLELRRIAKKKTCLEQLQMDYEDMLLSGRSSDLTIVVKQKEIHCHRCILETRSPVFAAMLKHDMKEKNNGVVTIQDAEPTTFQQFLLYLYTASEHIINMDNVADLYVLGDKYAVDHLKELCVTHIKNNLSFVYFCEIFELALFYSILELKGVITECFIDNFNDITGNEAWVKVVEKKPIECYYLMKAFERSDKFRQHFRRWR